MNNLDFNDDFWKDKIPLTDSRQVRNPEFCIFFAMKGKVNDGHKYIGQLYQKGVRNFVVSEASTSDKFYNARFIVCDKPLEVLQKWATFHRSLFSYPVVAITGSNGKTIIKECLYQLLHDDKNIVKSPRSYNSQLGVPLSVLQMNYNHELAIFEAGISRKGEMERLEKIIRPDIGILTNIGSAHDEGFSDSSEKISEKLLLFKNCKTIIFRDKLKTLKSDINRLYKDRNLLSWGADSDNDVVIKKIRKENDSFIADIDYKLQSFSLCFPFSDDASFENIMHCVVLMLHLNYNPKQIQKRIEVLNKSISMRLEWKAGINKCMIVDDTYNNDLAGLRVALDFMEQKHQDHISASKTLILSDIPQSSMNKELLYTTVARWLKDYNIQRFIAVGPVLSKLRDLFKSIPEVAFYEDTDLLLLEIGKKQFFKQETILIKGARIFEFERIVKLLQKRTHNTVLELDLNALLNNFNVYRRFLNNDTKIMVMVKAFAYGSSSYEIARLLQYHKVDYLGVAYIDEGVDLRKKGIISPIMVMNPSVESFSSLIEYDLEPSIYSLSILNKLIKFLSKNNPLRPLKIHIELDSGMHRLGFSPHESEEIISILKVSSNFVNPVAVFSHLAAADESEHDDFTKDQIQTFENFANVLETGLDKKLIKHILNSAGISKFSNKQFDMVRLGIGLHGLDPNATLKELKAVATLKTVISQVKTIEAGEAVGYGRHSVSPRKRKIATLAIGYADGLMRASGNYNANVLVNGVKCPLVGNICMDMCFADISAVDAKEGDEVIIFGPNHPIEQLASAVDTIPYEILTRISGRVPRVFYEE